MGSVMKRLMGAMPLPPEFLGSNRPWGFFAWRINKALCHYIFLISSILGLTVQFVHINVFAIQLYRKCYFYIHTWIVTGCHVGLAESTMATAASVTTDLTTCCICLDVFDNPKSLPCLHAFCLKCLQGYFKDKCPGDDVPCPLCRKDFQIPSDGLSGLQHHFFIDQLVEDRKFSSEGLPDVPCVVCLEESDGSSEEIATATVYCVDCRQKLCERCSRPHRRMAGGAHQLRALGAELEQELIQQQAGSCDKHRDKQVELYCYQCNENICVLCFASKHRNHENSEIPEVAERFRSKVESDNQQIVSAISTLRNQL